jgi:hypothetical protein
MAEYAVRSFSPPTFQVTTPLGYVTYPYAWPAGIGNRIQLQFAYGTETIPYGDPDASNTMKLVLTINTTGTRPAGTVAFINDAAYPPSTDPIAAPSILSVNLGTFAAGDWTSLGGNAYQLDFTFNVHSDYPTTGFLTNNRSPVITTVKNATWNGNFTLELGGISYSAGAPNMTGVALNTVEVPEFTSWRDAPAHIGRPLRDQKTGLPVGSHQMVEDGYVRGVWTSARQWDPDDPRNERPTELPSTEGERGDDVPVT